MTTNAEMGVPAEMGGRIARSLALIEVAKKPLRLSWQDVASLGIFVAIGFLTQMPWWWYAIGALLFSIALQVSHTRRRVDAIVELLLNERQVIKSQMSGPA
jgi:hypothetical protein